MEFSFKLNWEELGEELKEQKIDDVIEAEGGDIENQDDRSSTEDFIKAHFPIYF